MSAPLFLPPTPLLARSIAAKPVLFHYSCSLSPQGLSDHSLKLIGDVLIVERGGE